MPEYRRTFREPERAPPQRERKDTYYLTSSGMDAQVILAAVTKEERRSEESVPLSEIHGLRDIRGVGLDERHVAAIVNRLVSAGFLAKETR